MQSFALLSELCVSTSCMVPCVSVEALAVQNAIGRRDQLPTLSDAQVEVVKPPDIMSLLSFVPRVVHRGLHPLLDPSPLNLVQELSACHLRGDKRRYVRGPCQFTVPALRLLLIDVEDIVALQLYDK